MRAVELAKVAAAAEALRLRRIAHRQMMRVAYGAGAVVFIIAVFVLLHVVAYDLLLNWLSPVIASLILLVFDLIVGGLLGYLAMSNKPDPIETEALAVRKQALIEMKRSITMMSVAGQVAGLVVRRRARKVADPRSPGRTWLLGQIASRVLARR